MPIPVDIASLFASCCKLEEQMQELRRLRRALYLLNAERNRMYLRRRRNVRRISKKVMSTPNAYRTATTGAQVIFAHTRFADSRRSSD
jgi:hypothetical protein